MPAAGEPSDSQSTRTSRSPGPSRRGSAGALGAGSRGTCASAGSSGAASSGCGAGSFDTTGLVDGGATSAARREVVVPSAGWLYNNATHTKAATATAASTTPARARGVIGAAVLGFRSTAPAS